MASWTLAQLKTKVRERADMVYSQFVSDSELQGYISASYSDYYDQIVKVYADQLVSDPVSFTIVSGNTYTLDTNFYKLVGLDFQDGTDWREVRSFDFNERNSNNHDFGRGYYHPILKYRLIGNKLRFIPIDQATGTYRYWYIPLYTPLLLDADTMDGYNGWEEYIVIDAAIKCLLKEETSVKELLMLREEWRTKIAESAQNRDAGQSQRIIDVQGYDY